MIAIDPMLKNKKSCEQSKQSGSKQWKDLPQLPEGINDCLMCGGQPGCIYARDQDFTLHGNDKQKNIQVAKYVSIVIHGKSPEVTRAWNEKELSTRMKDSMQLMEWKKC